MIDRTYFQIIYTYDLCAKIHLRIVSKLNTKIGNVVGFWLFNWNKVYIILNFVCFSKIGFIMDKFGPKVFVTKILVGNKQA